MIAVACAAGVLLSACGAAARTPIQELDAAVGKTTALHTMKMDFTAKVGEVPDPAAFTCSAAGELPPSLSPPGAPKAPAMTPQQKAARCAQLAKSAATMPTSFAITMTGSGAVRLPDEMSMAMDMAMQGITVHTEVIALQGQMYLKDPTTGAWKSGDQLGLGLDPSTFSNMQPNTGLALLDAAKSVTDKGDQALGDVRVHHYVVVLDPTKMRDKVAGKKIFKDPKMQQFMEQVMKSLTEGTFSIEVWIGINDDLIRREVLDYTMTGARGATGIGAMFKSMTIHSQSDYHDFNSKVDIKAPTTS